jgi:UPF0716 protein FxsA
MLLVLFLVFLVTPVVEIAVFIKVGGLIGVQATIAIVLVNAVLGALLLRSQGLATLTRARKSLEQGRPPVEAVVDGVGLIVAGALMVTPGLVTDAVGFFLLIPPFRRWAAMALFRRLARSSIVRFQVYHSSEHPGAAGGEGWSQANDAVIDVDYEVMDEPPDSRRGRPGKGPRSDGGSGPASTRR